MHILQDDLNKKGAWGSQWMVTFIAEKTEGMIFFRKHKNSFHPSLKLHGQLIKQVDHHKHLGIYFSKDLTWKKHVDSILSKVSNRTNILKCIQRKAPRRCLENIYTSMIQPIIDYGDIIYDNINKDDAARLENIP